MTESEFREAVLRLVASPVDDLSFEDKAAIVQDAVTPKPIMATVAAKAYALRNALLCGLGVLTVVGCIVATVWLGWGVPLPFALLGSLLALLGLVGIIILAGWLRGRSTSGQLLLDLGSNPMRAGSRKVVWSLGVFAVTCVAATSWTMPEIAIIAGGSPGLVALFFFFLGRGRLQVRENGLWVYLGLLRWEDIGSWHWQGDSALWVRTRGFSSWYQRVLAVAAGQRQEVQDLLVKYCSGASPPIEIMQPIGAASKQLGPTEAVTGGPR